MYFDENGVERGRVAQMYFDTNSVKVRPAFCSRCAGSLRPETVDILRVIRVVDLLVYKRSTRLISPPLYPLFSTPIPRDDTAILTPSPATII